MIQFRDCIRTSILFFVLISFHYKANYQNNSISGTALINYYILKNQLKLANSNLNLQIAHYKKLNQIDSLYNFPIYFGKVTLLNNSAKIAVKKTTKQ